MPGFFPHPGAFDLQKNIPAQPDPFIWLLEIRNPTNGPLIDPEGGGDAVLRLTPNLTDVEFGVDSLGAPIVWESYPWSFGEMRANTEGDLTPMSLTLANVLGDATKWWEANDFFRNHTLYLHLVHSAQLSDPSAKWTTAWKISSTDLTLLAITATLAAGSFVDFDVPQSLVTDTCRHDYRQEGCFFIGDPGDTLGDCELTVTACRLRGTWELDNGLPVLHPRQFGGAKDSPVGP